MKQQDCIFCKIVAGEIPSYKIHENDEYLAFLDISRFVEGHTLCVPKQHVKVIWDSSDIASYYEFVQKVGNHFREKGYKYVDTLTMGREVPHAHVHLIPHSGDNDRWDAAMENVYELQRNAGRDFSKEDAERILEKLSF